MCRKSIIGQHSTVKFVMVLSILALLWQKICAVGIRELLKYEQTIEMILRTIIVHIVAEGQLAPHPTHRETTKPDGQWQKFASGYCQPGGCLCQGFCRSIEDESPISYIFSGLKWVEVLKMFLSFMMSLVMSIAMSPKVIARYEHGIRLCLSSSEAACCQYEL